MNPILLAVALLCANAELPDGSLIFLERSNRVVEFYTSGKITHVGVVLNDDREPWIYEATPDKVRRVRVEQYYAEIGALNQGRHEVRICVVTPNNPYNDEQLTALRTYLDSQLNRRYSVKNYVRKKPGDGIHCAELAASSLAKTGRFDFGECYDESPQSVFDKVQSNHQIIADFRPEPPPRIDESWCTRSRKWWVGFCDWCSWSCYETWTFCR